MWVPSAAPEYKHIVTRTYSRAIPSYSNLGGRPNRYPRSNAQIDNLQALNIDELPIL